MKRRDPIKQSILPHYSLKRSLDVAKAICDNYASKETPPHIVAQAVGYSPTSYNWRLLSGAATAYGLTNGAYKSKGISVTELGQAIIMSTEPGQKEKSLIEAALKPKVLHDFFTKYNRQKFPQKEFAVNVLKTIMNVPPERANEIYELIKETGEFVGIITDTKSGKYVSLDIISTSSTLISLANHNGSSDTIIEPPQSPHNGESAASDDDITQFASNLTKKFDQTHQAQTTLAIIPSTKPNNTRVFISHGKNKQIVEQLKEIILFGKYEPIISVERESTSKPVPEKVLDDMRSCFASVIIINSEEELTDQHGCKRKKINDNVLIEIGAALALYHHNNILLVQKGIDLPSNLQGLYRCEFEGDTLDMEATIKLLKGFNEFN